MVYEEARITINGTEISPAMSMTLRVAIESFKSDLVKNPESLGNDAHGLAMHKLYLQRIEELEVLLLQQPPKPQWMGRR